MGAKGSSDEIIRLLAGDFRVMTLGGVAVIASGLSRNTFDADIWVEPMDSAERWAKDVARFIYDAGPTEVVAIGSWQNVARKQLAAVIERFLTLRVAEVALAHADQAARDLGRRFRHELAQEGDPFAVENLRKIGA